MANSYDNIKIIVKTDSSYSTRRVVYEPGHWLRSWFGREIWEQDDDKVKQAYIRAEYGELQ